MTGFLLCLGVLAITALAAGATLPKTDLERRHTIVNGDFSFMSQVTFETNGDCSIFGHYLTEPLCRWVLREKYDAYRFYYFTFVNPNRMELFRNGSCILQGHMFPMEDCRHYMGTSRYDQTYVDAFGLPDIDIDDQGYCMMGDTELAPEDCPVMIGEAVYKVLLSIKSYS